MARGALRDIREGAQCAPGSICSILIFNHSRLRDDKADINPGGIQTFNQVVVEDLDGARK